MPWKIHIDPKINCAFVKFYGPYEDSQIEIAAEEMFNHPEYKYGMNSLRDIRDQIIPAENSFKTIASQAQYMMNEFDHKIGFCRWAIVAGDGQSYAKVHQYLVAGRLSKTPIERKLFRDIEKAKEWLGIPEEYEIEYPEFEKTA